MKTEHRWHRQWVAENKAKSLDALDEAPCVVLLGDPGMGKSTEMRNLRERMSQTSDVLWIDLKAYGSEDRLTKKINEDPLFVSWRRGSGLLYLLLDSLDEGRHFIRNLDSLLLDQLENCRGQLSRLRLRLACRSAEWPLLLDEELPKLWEHQVSVWTLAPLQESDIALAANERGMQGNEFLAQATMGMVMPFAERPITLNMLLDLYESGKTLPATREEIFARGCLKLCEDPSDSREAAGTAGTLGPETRLELAKYIASALLFNGRSSFFAGKLHEEALEDLSIHDLLAELRKSNTLQGSADKRALQETLNTSLFTRSAPNRMVLAHQSYGDYLTAALIKERFGTSDAMRLVTAAAGPRRRVVPQLHGVTSWLVSLDPSMTCPHSSVHFQSQSQG